MDESNMTLIEKVCQTMLAELLTINEISNIEERKCKLTYYINTHLHHYLCYFYHENGNRKWGWKSEEVIHLYCKGFLRDTDISYEEDTDIYYEAESTEKQTVPAYIRLYDLLSFDFDVELKKKWWSNEWPTKLYGRFEGGSELIEIKYINSLVPCYDGKTLYSKATCVPSKDIYRFGGHFESGRKIWTDISMTYEDAVDLLKKSFVFDNLIKSLDTVKRED